MSYLIHVVTNFNSVPLCVQIMHRVLLSNMYMYNYAFLPLLSSFDVLLLMLQIVAGLEHCPVILSYLCCYIIIYGLNSLIVSFQISSPMITLIIFL